MKIALGCDHAGYEPPEPLKPAVLKFLTDRGHEVVDCGAHGPESVDYPDFADKVCAEILEGRCERGVLICGTGMGICMAANRHRGIHASLVMTPEMARLARDHNNSNVICVGSRTHPLPLVFELIEIWLVTPFSGGERHLRRLKKID